MPNNEDNEDNLDEMLTGTIYKYMSTSSRKTGRKNVYKYGFRPNGHMSFQSINPIDYDKVKRITPVYSQALSSAVRNSQINIVGASNVMSYLREKDNVSKYVFRPQKQKDNGARVRKSKRANKRTHKKQRTNRRKNLT